jgi:formate dehydrogenase gamma subunit
MDITRRNEAPEFIRRFTTYRVFEHWALIAAFLILSVTGLSQKFHTFGMSQWVILYLGGIDTVRWLHHGAGIALAFLALQHMVVAAAGVLARRWDPHMVITVSDFRDALTNVKYYVGILNHPALCDRYNYKQKFVYWLVLTGAVQMAATGFILWFPVASAQHLPGQFIPAAKALHANQAMLLFLFIAIWHIYDSIFSPDVFPLDTSIFSGYISTRRMEKEHPLELMRLEGASNDEILRAKYRTEGGERPSDTVPS